MSIMFDGIINIQYDFRSTELEFDHKTGIRCRIAGPHRLSELYDIFADKEKKNYTSNGYDVIWCILLGVNFKNTFSINNTFSAHNIGFYVDIVHNAYQNTLDVVFENSEHLSQQLATSLAAYLCGRVDEVRKDRRPRPLPSAINHDQNRNINIECVPRGRTHPRVAGVGYRRRLEGIYQFSKLDKILRDDECNNYSTSGEHQAIFYLQMDVEFKEEEGGTHVGEYGFCVDVVHDSEQHTLDVVFDGDARLTDELATLLTAHLGGLLATAKK